MRLDACDFFGPGLKRFADRLRSTPAMTAMTIDDQVTSELPWLRRLARQLARDEAEDLVQETWILARRDRPQARGRGLRPWLATAMRNRWYSMRRSSVARARREELAPVAEPEAPPDHAVLEADVIRVLDEALDALSDEDRAILRDRFFEGRTAAQIAGDLGIPAATVRTRIHRSLARLRVVLDERHGNDRSVWAPAVAAVPMGKTVTWTAGLTMATATKGLVMAGALAGLAALGWMMVRDDGGEPAPQAVAEVAIQSDEARAPGGDAPDPGEVDDGQAESSDLAAARTRWRRKLDAIEKARRARGTDDEPAPDPTAKAPGELPPPPDLVAQMSELGCLDLLPDHPKGRLAIAVNYVGEPGVGTVIESVDVVEDSMNAPELRECWTESMYMLDLEPPAEPVRGTYNLHYNAGDGEVVKQLLPLFKAYLQEHPELLEEHEVFGKIAELPDDAGMNQWMTPEFMQYVGEHPEFNQELNEYFGSKLGEPSEE